ASPALIHRPPWASSRGEYPPRPAVGARPAARIPRMPSPLVVQKFGGSSLADADRIRRVARRIAQEHANGSRLVVAVSAMGDTTDELLAVSGAITKEPDRWVVEMLLATSEHQ